MSKLIGKIFGCFLLCAILLARCSTEEDSVSTDNNGRNNYPSKGDSGEGEGEGRDSDVVQDDDDSDAGKKVCEPFEKVCEKNIVLRCDGFGRGWGIYEECAGEELCVDGECIPLGDDDDSDADADVPDTDDDDDDDDDCHCPPEYVCNEEGICVLCYECKALNLKQCASEDTYRICVEKDGCLFWSERACDDGLTCRGKTCGADECPEGIKQCDGLVVKYCDDFNKDGFVEWNVIQVCENSCKEGKCGCADDSNCKSPTPYCENLECVECRENSDCEGGEFCENNACICEFVKCAGVCCKSGEQCHKTDYVCCAPDCSGKECGDDGCGGSCGVCDSPPDDYCVSGLKLRRYSASGACNDSSKCSYPYSDIECEYGCLNGACQGCTPNCADKCGGAADGCGGSCTAPCSSGKVCQSQTCVACGALDQPCCDSNQCNSPLTCQSGMCKTACTPNCADKCGGASDGCGGTCAAPCSSGKVCQSQTCVACGGDNQPCCDGNQCNSPLTCQSGTCKTSGGGAGNHLFSKRFGSTGYDRGLSVSTDSGGNIFVTGRFEGTVNFGGGNLTSAGDRDIFLIKYSP
ncbi:MAG: hypothetical protein Kow0090_21110 [Myxococcota bacterium]